MDTQAMQSVLKSLWAIGWASDDWFNGCDVPNHAVEEAFEAMVHELAHSVVVAPEELLTPKDPCATSRLAKKSDSPDSDEVTATAVTILTCKFFDSDVREEASFSMNFNLKNSALGLNLKADLRSPETQAKSELLIEYLLRLV